MLIEALLCVALAQSLWAGVSRFTAGDVSESGRYHVFPTVLALSPSETLKYTLLVLVTSETIDWLCNCVTVPMRTYETLRCGLPYPSGARMR